MTELEFYRKNFETVVDNMKYIIQSHNDLIKALEELVDGTIRLQDDFNALIVTLIERDIIDFDEYKENSNRIAELRKHKYVEEMDNETQHNLS